MSGVNWAAPTIDVGGGVSANGGPVTSQLGGKLKVSSEDNHASALIVLMAVGALYLLWKGRFRFSMTVGGR